MVPINAFRPCKGLEQKPFTDPVNGTDEGLGICFEGVENIFPKHQYLIGFLITSLESIGRGGVVASQQVDGIILSAIGETDAPGRFQLPESDCRVYTASASAISGKASVSRRSSTSEVVPSFRKSAEGKHTGITVST